MRNKPMVTLLSTLLFSIFFMVSVSAHGDMEMEEQSEIHMGDVHIQIDGEAFMPTDQPFIHDARTFVPVRAISEELGFKVGWVDTTDTVTLTKGQNEIQLVIGSKTVKFNGLEMVLDVAPMIVNDRTYVPLRFISEGIGANVTWNGQTSTVGIEKTTDPQLRVFFPKEDQVVKGDQVKVGIGVFNFELVDFRTASGPVEGQGHLHIWLDQDVDNAQIAYKMIKPGVVTYDDVKPGEHTLTVQLQDNTHKPLQPVVKKVIHFTTKMANDETAENPIENVTINGFDYDKKVLTIKKGTSVTWTNQDEVAHTATADDGSFDTGLIQKGESATVVFDEVGEFPYHCTPHPFMKGKVIVTE